MNISGLSKRLVAWVRRRLTLSLLFFSHDAFEGLEGLEGLGALLKCVVQSRIDAE